MPTYPSIFNDVLGPVMRGPSSSHCAASLRIGRLCRDLMGGVIDQIFIEFDPNGSLATTHESQGSDMGLFGGFMGWEADDKRLPESASTIETYGIQVHIHINDFGAIHPNTYKIRLINQKEEHHMLAISTGGGMIEVQEIDGAKVSIHGDYFETLIYGKSLDGVRKFIEKSLNYEEVLLHESKIDYLEIKSRTSIDPVMITEIQSFDGIIDVKTLNPVLPVLSKKELEVPFIYCAEMLKYNNSKGKQLWELAIEYESQRGGLSHKEVFEKMSSIVRVMKSSITNGLKGTHYEDRILGAQSLQFKEEFQNHRLIGADVLNRIIMYVSAIMEVKSSMGVIVAAPTAGSCGALPGTVIAVAESMELGEEDIVKAMLAAGIIGVFIAAHATFAAEVGGCMAECGSGSGMAAAALVQMAGGALDQSLSAASQSLQNSLGMICDPIANRVEAPCLGRNVQAASNALSCANMALAKYNHLIPLDEVIETMNTVGQQIDRGLRCTGLGGLAITQTSKEIEKGLKSKQFFKSC